MVDFSTTQRTRKPLREVLVLDAAAVEGRYAGSTGAMSTLLELERHHGAADCAFGPVGSFRLSICVCRSRVDFWEGLGKSKTCKI